MLNGRPWQPKGRRDAAERERVVYAESPLQSKVIPIKSFGAAEKTECILFSKSMLLHQVHQVEAPISVLQNFCLQHPPSTHHNDEGYPGT